MYYSYSKYMLVLALQGSRSFAVEAEGLGGAKPTQGSRGFGGRRPPNGFSHLEKHPKSSEKEYLDDEKRLPQVGT